MKITEFSPMVVSPNADEIIKLFEDLGFEKEHAKEGIEDRITSVTMTNENDFTMTIANSNHLKTDLLMIRMNVDNFDEAYKTLIEHGFVNPRGDQVTETPTSKSTLLYSPSGFGINITEHIKK